MIQPCIPDSRVAGNRFPLPKVMEVTVLLLPLSEMNGGRSCSCVFFAHFAVKRDGTAGRCSISSKHAQHTLTVLHKIFLKHLADMSGETLKELCFKAIFSELGYPNSQKYSTVKRYKSAIRNFRHSELKIKIPKPLVKEMIEKLFGDNVWDAYSLSDADSDTE